MSFSFKRSEVILKKGKAKPFWHQHPWIFSGAVKNVKGNPADGDVVDVFDDKRKFIGKGFINSHSQIRIRLLSWDLHEKLDIAFFTRKIQRAIELRKKILDLPSKSNCYRLIHSEGDGLPGLTVDLYEDFLAVQFTSLGMDQRKEMILDILKEETQVKTVIERYSAGYRKLEGLKEIDCLIHGPEPPQVVEVQEHGVKFLANLVKGQKTGFYIDQRENRLYASSLAEGRRVLDAFCYTGGFGVYLADKGKAKEVVFLDSSPLALDMAKTNARMNNCSKTSFIRADGFKELPRMCEKKQKFDMIILDPPKVAPGKKNVENGLNALRKLNAAAMEMLTPNGILITCDCSGDISRNKFVGTLNRAAIDTSREIRIFHMSGPGPDHPINPSCPENAYLKAIFCTVN